MLTKSRTSVTHYLATPTTIRKTNVIRFIQLNLLPLLTVSGAPYPIPWYLNTYRK